jgi:hypothetical protein
MQTLKLLSCWGVLGWVATVAGANDTPPLDMHFFENPQTANTPMKVAESVTVARTDYAEALPFEMVIYTSEPEPESEMVTGSLPPDYSGVSMQFSAGYLQSDLGWDVGSPTGKPNTLLDSQWDRVELFNIQAGLTADLPYGLALKTAGSYGWEISGAARQTLYMDDNRMSPFATMQGDSDDSYQWALSLGLGYPLDLGVPFRSPYWLRVTPLGGYAWNRQKYTLKNGRQTIDLPHGAAVDNADHNEELRYKADWDGPWLGADMTFGMAANHQFFSSFEHHWVDYSADGRSENNDRLVDGKYQHNTDATGINASVGYRFVSEELWGVTLSADYARLDGESGRETLYTSSGETFKSRLNDIEFESFGVNLGVNLMF